MPKKIVDKNQRQKQATMRIAIMVAILVCVNILASYYHSGIDLTKEKRFTLSPSTKKLLGNMKEVAVVDVYLKGKFPAMLQRLQEAVRERLRSFKDYAGNKIVFHFIDPFEGKTESEQKIIAHDLEAKGIRFLNLSVKDDEDYTNSNKPFFPYALVQYNGREVPVMLLEDPPHKSAAEKISYAEATLEYKFASAINQLNKNERTRVAYIVGNGEDLGIKSYDMLATLPHYYDLDTITLADLQYPLYEAAIIAQPTSQFSGPQKLKIDQYVMHGGHILWAFNQLNASLDSLAAHPPQIIAMEYGLALDDLLFKYGCRVNNDLVEDMQCMQLARTQTGGTPEMRDWIYFPRLNPTAEHPIVRNMDFILGRFTNSIDTIRSPEIQKTVLLQTSKYSLSARSPVRVSLTMMNFPLQHEMFTKSYLPVAVLLEGKFHSAFQNLLAPEFVRYLDSVKQPFKPVCDTANRMIVVSVGDIFSSEYTTKDGLLPMGYYKWSGEFFANRNFLLNCMEYLTDRSGILEARSKEVKLRLLDSGRTKSEKSKWQFINVSIPIAAVLVFASCYLFFRKRRYENKDNNPVKPIS